MQFNKEKILKSEIFKENILKSENNSNDKVINDSLLLDSNKLKNLYFSIKLIRQLGEPKIVLPDRILKYRIFKNPKVQFYVLKIWNFLDRPNRNRYNSLIHILEELINTIEEFNNEKK